MRRRLRLGGVSRLVDRSRILDFVGSLIPCLNQIPLLSLLYGAQSVCRLLL